MKRTTRMNRAAWVVLMLPLVAIGATFQNCSKVDFATAADPAKTTSGDKTTMYQEAVVGQAAVPPLKLIFIVDNSYTMQANQISLASAFGSMFAGSNASNLSPFDSTAYIFTTSQASIDPANSSAFSLLPTVSYDDMRSMSASNLSAMRGLASAQVDGKFAGDLVSYSVNNTPDPATLMKRVSYNVTPVLGINATGSDPISLGAHKSKAGSVSDFAADFSNRISYISPLRSKYDSAGHGVLDPVIDHESGLCALARVLKNDSKFLSKGDLAAFVIVSDEDDNDPSGANCVDAYQDFKDADLIDAHCETPQTKFGFNLPNSTQPSCSFNYQNGFTYTTSYNAPTTNVSFNEAYHQYENAQTSLAYWTSKYTYDQYKYVINYWSSNPTYSQPQVKVSWFTKSTACKERDGVKFDCVDSYAPASTVVNGSLAAAGSCSAFAGAVPSNAVKNDSSHPIACAQAASVAKSGACSPTDTSIENCNQNFKQETAITVYNDSDKASCSALVSGKLTAAGAITSFNDAAHAPSCSTAAVASGRGTGNGECDGSKPNCVATYTKASSLKTVGQFFDGSDTSCKAAIASAKLSSVSGAITSTTGAHPVVCSDTSYWESKATLGACPSPLPGNVLACNASVAPHAAVNFNGTLGSLSCADFFKNVGQASYPSAIASSASCSSGSPVKTSADTVVAYSASNFPGFIAVKSASCPQGAVDAGKAKYGAAYLGCSISAVSSQSKSYSTLCTDPTTSANIASVCSNASNHNCSTPVDNAAAVQNPYQTTVTYKTVPGTLTCDTACSAANGACGATTTGKVGDVLHNCQSAPDSILKSNSQTAVLASMKAGLCAAPATTVVDKSYTSSKTEPQYVAGMDSKNKDPNALANYIKRRSQELLGAELPATSVFVRQTDGGNGGKEGKNYKAFASAMGGANLDVTSPASVYASSLQSLSGVIKDKLNRSFSIQGFTPDQVVTRAWYQAAGTTEWIEKQEGVDWTASGGTVTVSQSMEIHTGDNLRFEYK